MLMEQDRKEKARVPAKVRALAVRVEGKAAVKGAAREEVVGKARERAKVAARGKDKDGGKDKVT